MPLRRVRLRTKPTLLAALLAVLLAAGAIVPSGDQAPAHAIETRSISGRVTLGTAATPPAAGEVVVEYRQSGADPDPANVRPVAPDGTYRIEGLPDGTSWFVYFRYLGADSFVSQWFKEDPAVTDPFQGVYIDGQDRTGIDQVLQRKGLIRGVVSLGVETTTAPEGSVSVSYRVYQGGSTWSPWSDGVPVDAAGAYEMRDLPPSKDYQLAFAYTGDGPFQSMYWQNGHYEHQASTIDVGASWHQDGTVANATLPGTAQLSGQVFLGTTATTAPADSVRVSLEYGMRTWGDATWTWAPVPSASVLVGADGRYALSGLDSAKYRLTIEYLAGTAYAPKTVIEHDIWGTASTQDVTLTPAYTLSGRVYLGSTDRPAGAGEVLVTAKRLFPSDWPAFGPVPTAADGSYVLTGLPSTNYELRLHYTGSEDFPDLTWGSTCDTAIGCRVPVAADTTGQDVVMPAGRGLYGVVTDAAGAPLEGITVTTRVLDGTSGSWVVGAETSTAADGSYRFNAVADAEYVVSFSDPSGAYASQNWPGWSDYYEPWLVDTKGGRDPGSIDATMLRSAAIEGRVDGIGFSPDSADLEVEVVVYDDHTASWVGTGDVYPVDSSGRYRIPGLLADWYRVAVWYYGPTADGRGISNLLTLDEGETLVADLEVKRVGLAPARDFSEDGLADVLVRAADGRLIRYAGSGDGGWGAVETIGTGWGGMTSVFSAGDFTGDGNPDVLARDHGGYLWLYPRNGSGGWKAPSRVGSGWSSFSELFSPGDFDGDGAFDVMARDSAGRLWLYRGDGAGGWRGAVHVGTGWGHFSRIFAPGDFDGDGNDDVLARDTAGTLWLYPGNGRGGWRTQSVVGGGWNIFTAIVGAGDFDGDGGPDVMGRDTAGQLWLYRGDGAAGWLSSGAGHRIGWGWSGLHFVD